MADLRMNLNLNEFKSQTPKQTNLINGMPKTLSQAVWCENVFVFGEFYNCSKLIMSSKLQRIFNTIAMFSDTLFKSVIIQQLALLLLHHVRWLILFVSEELNQIWLFQPAIGT